MTPILPTPLRLAAARLIERIGLKELAAKSAMVSDHYRRGLDSARAIGDDGDVSAYLAARMPATFAAMTSVLSRIGGHAPGFAPKTLLDAGAGPGTASWAAAEQWSSLQQVTMIECNARMLAAARSLCQSANVSALRDASLVAGEIATLDAVQTYDLVLAGYAVAEMHEPIEPVLGRLWGACNGILVIVEPGTPSGFARILQCRAHLLKLGARMLAPCPGDYPCPNDWCHFSVRLPRTRGHMRAKGAKVPFEDEKYSYLAAARDRVLLTPAQARIVAEPRVTKPGVTLRLCANGEIAERFVARRDKPAFKQAAKLSWGDAVGL